MKNKVVNLHDGKQIVINDDEWSSVANCKVFDDENTEIVRITRGPSGLIRVYAMRAVNVPRGETLKKVERNEIVLPGGSIKAAVETAIKQCGLGKEIASKVSAAL